MTSFTELLARLRENAQTEREKGNYFERIAQVYFQNEPYFKDLYSQVWLWEDWRQYWVKQGNPDPGADTGIDLVAKTDGTNEYHAIQAKFYDANSTLYKGQIDSFFTASGKKPFTQRFIIVTTDHVSRHADAALQGQRIPVQKITLTELQNSKIDWDTYFQKQVLQYKEPKSLRPYQEKAIRDVSDGLQEADRGKLIMACGTGKTFTALRLAEKMAGKGGNVLFLVPSLNLLSQTLTEWTQEAVIPVHSYAVCSDSEVGKKQGDDFEMQIHELQYPATTNAKNLANAFIDRQDKNHMNVVYSTYHSIDVVSRAQQQHSLPEFDLIICDEAHRTTGAKFDGEDESAFVRVHNANFIKGKKRVYMTATPRVYGVAAKVKAETGSITLFSMNDEKQFGKTLHTLTFSEAVHNLQILSDYKVIVLTVSEDHISKNLQKLLADENNSLKVSDAAKIVGCWRALSKMDSQDDLAFDPDPMKRAVAFCQVIEVSKGKKTHKISSKQISSMFQRVVDEYRATLLAENPDNPDEISSLLCEAEHVDGGMNAQEKDSKLSWLKADMPDNTCRILSNVRCLSEGVDVPALDAVLFMTPRNSQVDVVQSVGRVMRKPPNSNKKLGYVILPVVIPAGLTPEEALNDNQTYRVVWEVLQALRSHDDRFDAMINKLDLTGQDRSKMEVIAITDHIGAKRKKQTASEKALSASRKSNLGKSPPKTSPDQSAQLILSYEVSEIERAIVAKVVQKCGNRLYWDEWATDIARIAQTHISRIGGILNKQENTAEIAAFTAFLDELRDDLNDSISEEEAIEMLAQHMITRPVFDALFEDYSFTQHNPVSQALQGVLAVLDKHHIEKEADTLERFYESVRMRIAGIEDVRAKQKIVSDLYDKFFRNAFPKMTERLGIVYTPVEVVDFIIHSINDVLQSEFKQSLGSKNVHIIDPFTGTGTFITRLLQSGLIKKDELAYKYKNEIHANEIVLLAYYIAAVNIEQVYHHIMGGEYESFEGICLTDTFAMYEKDDLISKVLEDNSTRRKRQKALDIRVIMGNPPYSIGQRNENDNNDNIAYPCLDERIRSTYAANSKATLSKGLYDSYIRAIRWASDRIGNAGVIGFVTNAGWLEANTADGLRLCLAEEFSSLHVFHLRGNQRTSGETSRKEGGKIFGSGSRAPIAISILVKNPAAKQLGQIHFHDIGDYLTREEKLEKIAAFGSVTGITKANAWQTITPDAHGDWLRQRDDRFDEHIALGDKKSGRLSIFDNYSQGVLTARDAWAYNASRSKLETNMRSMIGFYHSEVQRFNEAYPDLDTKARVARVDDFIDTHPERISWTRSLKQELVKGRGFEFERESIVTSLYRPFTKQWMYFNRRFNEMVYQMPRIFPEAGVENLVICLTGLGESAGFSCLLSNVPPNFHFIAGSQCFPLYLYDEEAQAQTGETADMFAAKPEIAAKRARRDAITDEGLAHFQEAYPGEKISKEDLFYYIYGLLHSPEYRERYADNLSKELPRIPRVKTAADFWAFSKAGRALAELHLNYESVEPYPLTIEATGTLTDADYRVEKMKLAKKGDLSTVAYNGRITLKNIPAEAWEYVVNGKPALDWVMERQAVRTDKASGIVNDANDWATETMGDPAYPLKLFQRIITVSLETMKIVKALPKLDIKSAQQEKQRV